MTAAGPPRRPRHSPRRLAALALLVSLATLSATGALALLPSGRDVARGGPLPMHQPSAPGVPPDDANPAPRGVVTVAVPVGPHLVVPILYYHYIRNIQPTAQNLLAFHLSIPPALFAEQMALLHVEGAHPITLATLMAALAGKQNLPSHPVVLTFDDGYADFATVAQPVLARYGFVATDFVVSGFVNRPRYMSTAQILQMQSDGMVIGAHTVHHVDLAALPPAVARNEIDTSKRALEALLGHPVLDFAYPYGDFDPTVVQLVAAAGFRDAVTTMSGDQQAWSERFVLHRSEIGGAPTLAWFAEEAGVSAPTTPQLAVITFLSRAPAAARTA